MASHNIQYIDTAKITEGEDEYSAEGDGMTDKTEDEKLKAILKKLDEFEMTPEMIDDAEKVAMALGRMTLEDWFTEFTI